jgi:hypothetical protein
MQSRFGGATRDRSRGWQVTKNLRKINSDFPPLRPSAGTPVSSRARIISSAIRERNMARAGWIVHVVVLGGLALAAGLLLIAGTG